MVHYYSLDETDSVHMVELLKECREQRRDVKDAIQTVIAQCEMWTDTLEN